MPRTASSTRGGVCGAQPCWVYHVGFRFYGSTLSPSGTYKPNICFIKANFENVDPFYLWRKLSPLISLEMSFIGKSGTIPDKKAFISAWKVGLREWLSIKRLQIQNCWTLKKNVTKTVIVPALYGVFLSILSASCNEPMYIA